MKRMAHRVSCVLYGIRADIDRLRGTVVWGRPMVRAASGRQRLPVDLLAEVA